MRRANLRPIATGILVVGLPVLLAVGCQMMLQLSGYQRPWFNHKVHVVDKKMSCDDCHPDAATAAQAGMPSHDVCETCHEEIDKNKPPEERSTAFFPEGQPKWTNLAVQPADVIFSHATHVGKNVKCEECHPEIRESTRVPTQEPMRMGQCMECHARYKAPSECETCHRAIRKDRPTDDHRSNWIEVHGQASRAGHDERARCGLCHTDESCDHCHQEMKPRDHTNYWRIQGHGAMAEIDRDRCRACHRTDYCDRCHSEVAPRSHRGMWSGTRQLHCLSCHFPLGSAEGCVICHKSTPGHALAPPKPEEPPHTPFMNCRQCHFSGQMLPHVDNGSDCSICHR